MKQDKPWEPEKEHHPWCNFFVRPRDGCKMCEGLWKNYPLEPGQSAMDLMKKHFPNNVPRSGQES